MPATRVERMRHVDQIPRTVQSKAARPIPLQPREQSLFPPSPDEPRAGGFGFAGRPQLPERLEKRRHLTKIGGIAPRTRSESRQPGAQASRSGIGGTVRLSGNTSVPSTSLSMRK